MKTQVNVFDAETGTIINSAVYALDLKPALIAGIEQLINNNYNTWTYPADISGAFTGSARLKAKRLYKELGGLIVQAWQE